MLDIKKAQTEGPRIKVRQQKKSFPLLMMAPFFLLTTLFVIIPVILTIVMSFTNMSLTLEWNFIGSGNYLRIFGHPDIMRIIMRTLIFVAVNTILSVFGSIFVVIITTYYLDVVYHMERLGLFFRIVWLLPNLTPSVVYAFIWRFVFGPEQYGMLNKLFQVLGIPTISWFSNYAMGIIMFVCCLTSASGSIILFSSAVHQIPDSIFQAAKVDGAANMYICRRIVLPYLKWPIMQKTIWSVLGFFSTFEIIRLLTDGGPMGATTTYSYYIYQNAYAYRTFGLGAALSVFMVSMAIIFGLVILRVFRIDKQIREPRMDL